MFQSFMEFDDDPRLSPQAKEALKIHIPLPQREEKESEHFMSYDEVMRAQRENGFKADTERWMPSHSSDANKTASKEDREKDNEVQLLARDHAKQIGLLSNTSTARLFTAPYIVGTATCKDCNKPRCVFSYVSRETLQENGTLDGLANYLEMWPWKCGVPLLQHTGVDDGCLSTDGCLSEQLVVKQAMTCAMPVEKLYQNFSDEHADVVDVCVHCGTSENLLQVQGDGRNDMGYLYRPQCSNCKQPRLTIGKQKLFKTSTRPSSDSASGSASSAAASSGSRPTSTASAASASTATTSTQSSDEEHFGGGDGFDAPLPDASRTVTKKKRNLTLKSFFKRTVKASTGM